MTTVNLETFYHIVRQAVIDMEYLPGVQVNTFAVVDDNPDLFGQSFGYTFSDHENGYFWSRQWVLNGGDPNEIKGEFPALFIELNDSGIESGDHRVSLTLVDKIECDSCPAELVRTGPAVSSNLRQAVRALLAEVNSYGLYDRGDVLQWASEGRANSWGEGLLSPDDELTDYIDTSTSRVRPWGDYPGLRGVTLSLSLNACGESSAPFRYDTPTKPLTGSINCGC